MVCHFYKKLCIVSSLHAIILRSKFWIVMIAILGRLDERLTTIAKHSVSRPLSLRQLLV